jgi:hypothetical protein
MVARISIALPRARIRRYVTSLAVACAALGVAPALASARASLTVGVHTQPAGAAAAFTFHVTGPACPFLPPTNVTLTLHDGESVKVPLCRGIFTVTQDALPGWTVTSIDCVATPPDPQDPFVIDVPHRSADVELSPDEQKACTFTDTAPPAPPGPPGPPGPPAGGGGSPPAGSPPGATPPQPVGGAQAVSPARVRAARATLSAPRRCVDRRFTVTVRGGNVRSVAFSINGRPVRTVRARPNQRRFTVVLPARTAVLHVTARVTFSAAASPRTRTLRKTVRRCTPAALAPNFTG